jgi:drug/metabolite transporter (DMT)-like permease
VPPLAFATGTLTVAAAILVPAALIVEGVPRGFGWDALAVATYAALFPTALAFYLRVRVIRSAGSLFMSRVSYIVPVFAVLFGVLLLGEAVQPGLYAALALILGGIAIAQSRSILGLFRRMR